MDVAAIILITIIVFLAVDLLLRVALSKFRAKRIRRERERALSTGLQFDVSEEAPTLKRVELERPKARILAVDDERVILDSFRKMLVLGGYSIDTVENGAEALGLMRRHDYDFLFTDLKMPGMDGVEVTRTARHLRPDIDVIVITGYATIETAVETVRLGAMDYVEKPFTEDELLEFVKNALIKRQDRLAREMRHKLHPVRPGTGESRSRHELNVPAGIFVSAQHAWASIEPNGMVRIGLDDLVRKVFGDAGAVGLPAAGQTIRKGETLFSVSYGDYLLEIPAPLSGKVSSVNAEHAERPEWLAIKPFELSWMCRVEPTALAAELPSLRIGQEALEWYQRELDRFDQLAEQFRDGPEEPESGTEERQSDSAAKASLLASFMEPLLQC